MGKKKRMSLRWIQENKTAPTCDEESSDIDDSGTDESYDSNISLNNDDNNQRVKRHTTRHSTTTVTFDENGFVKITIVTHLPSFN